MTPLVAIDWGTSSLRGARLGPEGRVLEERHLPRGILTVEPGGFEPLLQQAFGDWGEDGTLFLLSGMVGSRQGWAEAAYCDCPAGFGDVAARLHWIRRTGSQRIAIVPGLCVESGPAPDVMRGEETQVFGALDLLGLRDGVFVLPGTHSKWVRVEAGRIVRFSTFMTGEFYALLRKHSILARTLPAEDGPLDEAAFRQGLAQARSDARLLQSAFGVRTLALFGRMPEAALPSYLSGLVIGEELQAQDPPDGPVVVIGNDTLTHRYQLALAAGGVRVRTVGATATWQGLWAIARHLQEHPA